MTKLIGNDGPTPEALAQMRNFRCKECAACKRVEAAKAAHTPISYGADGTPYGEGARHADDAMVASWNKVVAENPCEVTWHAYQSHDLGHYNIGHLQFLAVGPGCTFKEPPRSAPDSNTSGFGWRYVHVGHVNLATGAIEE